MFHTIVVDNLSSPRAVWNPATGEGFYGIVATCFQEAWMCPWLKTTIIRSGYIYVYHQCEHSVYTKSPVCHKNAWFDTKLTGSTQNCSTQHASLAISIIKHRPYLHWNYLYLCIHISPIITLVRHKKPRLPQNAWFDTKLLHPACITCHCHYQTSFLSLL